MFDGLFGFLLRRLPTVLQWVVTRLTNATPKDWADVLGWIEQAENDTGLRDGQARKIWVLKEMKIWLTHLAPYGHDLLLALGVAFLGQTGAIHLNKSALEFRASATTQKYCRA